MLTGTAEIAPARAEQRNSGFALIEAIVAMVILATLAVALQSGFSAGLRAIRVTDLQAGALAIARSELARAAPAAASNGQDGLFAWRVTSWPYADPVPIENGALAAYWVEVEVDWQDGYRGSAHRLDLKTLKLTSQR
jgi:prepilin-type N-terminal cleavage/methylation domain-containing protein